MDDAKKNGAETLLKAQLAVINIGLEGFADDLAAQSVPVVHVEWSPPASGDVHMAALLAKLGA